MNWETWSFNVNPSTRAVRTFEGDRRATWMEVLEGWAADPTFRSQWILGFKRAMSDLGARQVFWECPPLRVQNLNQWSESVLVAAPGLNQPADPSAFTDAMIGNIDSGDSTVVFPNLGGDAQLIAPRDLGGGTNYAYLADFFRTASDMQIDDLWAAIGRTALAEIHDEWRWISTSGSGVAWLHVRVEESPKYYTHAPYRSIGSDGGEGIFS